MRRLRSSIRFKLTALVASLVSVAAVGMALSAYDLARRTVELQVTRRLERQTSDAQRLLLAFIGRQEDRVAMIASRTRLRQLLDLHANDEIADDAFQTESRHILEDAQHSGVPSHQRRGHPAGEMLNIWIATDRGKVVTATTASLIGADLSNDPDLQQGRVSPHLGTPRLEGGKYVAQATTSVKTDRGRSFVVGALLNLDPMVEFLTNRTGLGETGDVLVGTLKEERLQLFFPPRNAPQTAGKVPLEMPAPLDALHTKGEAMRTLDERGVDVLAAYRPIGYGNWGMVAKMDTSEAFRALGPAPQFCVRGFGAGGPGGIAAVLHPGPQVHQPHSRISAAVGRRG